MGINRENKIIFVPKMHFKNIRGINPVLLVACYSENFGLFLLIIYAFFIIESFRFCIKKVIIDHQEGAHTVCLTCDWRLVHECLKICDNISRKHSNSSAIKSYYCNIAMKAYLSIGNVGFSFVHSNSKNTRNTCRKIFAS